MDTNRTKETTVTLTETQVKELRDALDHAPSSLIKPWMLEVVYGEDMAQRKRESDLQDEIEREVGHIDAFTPWSDAQKAQADAMIRSKRLAGEISHKTAREVRRYYGISKTILTHDGVMLDVIEEEHGDYSEGVEYKGVYITYSDANDVRPGFWTVSRDLREDEFDNYGLSDAVRSEARKRGLDVDADPETSCSYFYCDTLKEAHQIVDIIKEMGR